MDFENLKEQLMEKLAVYQSAIQESEIYIKLKERYDSLAPNVQTLIKIAAAFFVFYFFYSIPSSFVASSSEKMTNFEENRELTRDLIRAGRIAKTVQLPPPAPQASQLTQEIESKLPIQRILDSQKGTIGPATGVASKSLVPKSIKQSGAKASMKKLNIEQAIKLGEAFHQINGTKLINIYIQADQEDPHFYNVDYEVAAFDVPRDALEAASLEKGDKKGKGKKGRSRFKKKKGKGK